ncbi:MAG: LemA family protein [Lachnospiraceae bacterium]
MEIILWVTVAIAVIIVLYLAIAHNNLVKKNNRVKEAYSTMDVYLKKRWDLIPNLVNTVKGYAAHEKETLDRIVTLRNHSYDNMSLNDKMVASSQLSSGIARLLAIAESYPELKADSSFLNLNSELSKIETEIANSRKYYNAVVREYNNYIEMFPSNLVAAIFNYDKKEMFEIDDEARNNVKVEF